MSSRLIFPLAFALLACSATSPPTSTSSTTNTATNSTVVPAFYKLFGGAAIVTVDGNYVVITTTDLPDHKSPYYGIGNAKYEQYNGTNSAFSINPNLIIAQQLSFRIPITPTRLTTPSATPLGPIGVAVNGIAIFNQYAGGGQPLTGEINTFDQYNGHPQQQGQYHYHAEPYWITRNGKDALIGVLLDGYPVYGPLENGKMLTSADLDAAHGHTGATKEFPLGIYHYHTTADVPYINGSGFAGAPGTVGR